MDPLAFASPHKFAHGVDLGERPYPHPSETDGVATIPGMRRSDGPFNIPVIPFISPASISTIEVLRSTPLKLTSILTATCCVLFTSAAMAQGNDDCVNCTPVNGPGTYNFDNLTASMDGAPDILCDFFGTQDIDFDVWFCYTAASTATAVVNTCNQTTVDTKMAAYDGGCGSPILTCNDDACGLQSQLTFPVVAGNSYLLRIGTYPGAAGGPGTFTITEGGGGGGGNDDCANATAISGPGIYNFDNSAATMDGAPDILCDEYGTQDIDLDVWFAYTAASTATVTVETCTSSLTVDTKIAAYDGACGGAILDCNDDTCGLQSTITFAATAGNVYMLRVGSFPGAAGGIDTFAVTEE